MTNNLLLGSHAISEMQLYFRLLRSYFFSTIFHNVKIPADVRLIPNKASAVECIRVTLNRIWTGLDSD